MNPEVKVYIESMDGMRRSIRRALEGVDAKELNWNPLPGEANSLYAIVSHLCTSETGMLHQRITGQATTGGEPHNAFEDRGDDPVELLGRMDEVGNTTRRLMEGLTAEDLDRSIGSGGNRPSRTLREWISMYVRHQSLHLGHIEITKQFYEKGVGTGR
ncbi:MAG: uncharacterized protein HW388_1755 [Dehalococcoidia bacterium]|nr:uncharacterized protein [Dehalococcoidia bacterium]